MNQNTEKPKEKTLGWKIVNNQFDNKDIRKLPASCQHKKNEESFRRLGLALEGLCSSASMAVRK